MSKLDAYPAWSITIVLTPTPEDARKLSTNPDLAYDREVIRRATYHSALLKTNGNMSQAARLINIDRRSLQRKCPQNPALYAQLRESLKSKVEAHVEA